VTLKLSKLGAVVDAGNLFQGLRFRGRHGDAIGNGKSNDISEIVFTLNVVVTDPPKPITETRTISNDDTGIDLGDRPLGTARVLLLDDAQHAVALVADDASIAGRIIERHGQESKPSLGGIIDEPVKGLGLDQRHIAIEDEHAIHRRHRRHRLLHGMSGAQTLGLLDPIRLNPRKGIRHLSATMAVDHADLGRAQGRCSV